MKEQTIKTIATTAIVLLILALAWAVYQGSGKKSKARTVDNLNLQLGDLQVERDSLKWAVDSLQGIYNTVAQDYVFLENSLEDARKEVVKKEILFQKLRKSSTSEIDTLTRRMEDLLDSKKELLGIIEDTRTEKNDLLIRLNESKSELTRLNRLIGWEMDKLERARFRGTSFRATVEKRSDKLTAKARKAREIVINFDLNDVPERFRGTQSLYLLVTDIASMPLDQHSSTKVTVTENGQTLELLAQQVREIEILQDQQLTFSYELDDQLSPGTYMATVYWREGSLGTVSFQLR